DWQAKIELLERLHPPVVSFTFGCPQRQAIEALRSAGSEAWVTVTSAGEAREAERAGADVLVAQAAEAGGHRASFTDRVDLPVYGLLPLLSLIATESKLPPAASGARAW